MWLSWRASMNGMRIQGIVAAFVLCACSDRLSTELSVTPPWLQTFRCLLHD
jgi:hypothetical protein